MREEMDISNITLAHAVLSTEDKIFETIFKESGATKAELVKKTGIKYPEINNTVHKMEDKGYVVGRIENDTMYYLTAAGMYELEYRLNTLYFNKLHNILIAHGIDEFNRANYLRYVFYNFYMSGVFEEEKLLDNFILWCNRNNIPYEVEADLNIRTLKNN